MIRVVSLALLVAACASAGARGADVVDDIRAAQSSGNYARAAELYRQLIASGQDSAEIRSNLAAMLHFAGRDPEALLEAQTALKRNPNLPGPNLIAGLALSHLMRWREALPYLERAHKQDPHGLAPLVALGQAYVGVRDYARSNEAYVEATKLDPGNAEAWYGAGITYRSLADAAIKKSPPGTIPERAKQWLDQSLAALTKAVDLDPASPRAQLILAESYRDSKECLESVAQYEAVLKARPDDTAAELGLATAYWKCNETEKAVAPLQKVLKKMPADPEANGIMADVLLRMGNAKDAEPYAVTALKGNPELVQVRFALAKIELSEHRPEQAVAELDRIPPKGRDESYYFLLYRAYRTLGRDADAAAALEKFKERHEASLPAGAR